TNPTMWPIAGTGPYYAALVTGGTLDTKGGPKTDTEGRVLDDPDAPIPGLYGVRHCVASGSGASDWARGATPRPVPALAHTRARSPRAGGGPRTARPPARPRSRGCPSPGPPLCAAMSAPAAVPRTATVDGLRIEAAEHPGDPARRPFVLLHEGLGSVGLWRGF